MGSVAACCQALRIEGPGSVVRALMRADTMWSRANAPRAYTLCKIEQYHKKQHVNVRIF